MNHITNGINWEEHTVSVKSVEQFTNAIPIRIYLHLHNTYNNANTPNVILK